MKFRSAWITLAAGALTLPAWATSGFTPVQGEASAVPHAMAVTKSRAQVLEELKAWKRNPVTADGWRQVGGAADWVYEGVPSAKSRAQVVEELMQARRNPVAVDGWMNVGGELGAVYVGVPEQGLARLATVVPTPGTERRLTHGDNRHTHR